MTQVVGIVGFGCMFKFVAIDEIIFIHVALALTTISVIGLLVLELTGKQLDKRIVRL